MKKLLLLFAATIFLLSGVSCEKKEPPKAALILKKADYFYEKGDFRKALLLYKHVMEAYPETKSGKIAAENYVRYSQMLQSEIEANKKINFDRTKKLARAVELYYRDHRRYPNSVTDLIPKYIPKKIVDVWGNPIVYKKTKDGYVVACFGKDGIIGGIDEDTDFFIQNGEVVTTPEIK
ncbi:hypothetical protein TTHT_0086 [Thermotomaculum hydrothermale]|uniref:Tetratricopeptide repeat protein n=1 Tax=Thermotomaculum hydrothermale TaxID=981385 RepID=A0A7R6PLE4_9BACT|nr:type II secretion system protein GspG [Thermotomaculum hydrothermale]BBB31733.1 hypothetical protein TTHT_0086 [Thermotomaculum hydrothermale]